MLVGAAWAAPVITSISPAQGEPGTQVLIGGANFADVTQVKFNNTLADFTVLASDRILAVTPLESVSGQIAVVGLSGTGVTGGISWSRREFLIFCRGAARPIPW